MPETIPIPGRVWVILPDVEPCARWHIGGHLAAVYVRRDAVYILTGPEAGQRITHGEAGISVNGSMAVAFDLPGYLGRVHHNGVPVTGVMTVAATHKWLLDIVGLPFADVVRYRRDYLIEPIPYLKAVADGVAAFDLVPAVCPVCGTDLGAIGRPLTHFTEGGPECPYGRPVDTR